MNTQSSPAILKMGQVWQLTDCRIEIGLVGRTLVHYPRLRGAIIRTPIHLASQQSLELELRRGKAVMLAAAAAAAKKQAKKLSKNVPGSSQILRGGVFVERRRVGGGGTPATLPHRLN